MIVLYFAFNKHNHETKNNIPDYRIILTIAALAVIQGYFIYNTYKLKAEEAHAVITQQFLKLETSGKLDSINGC